MGWGTCSGPFVGITVVQDWGTFGRFPRGEEGPGRLVDKLIPPKKRAGAERGRLKEKPCMKVDQDEGGLEVGLNDTAEGNRKGGK